MVLSFVIPWLVAAACLGHWPRAWIDDPVESLGLWSWMLWVPIVPVLFAMSASPVLAIASTVLAALDRSREWRRRLGETVAGAALLWVCIVLLRWDPLRIVDWYFD